MENSQQERSVNIIQMHPYEYLTQVNSLYASCNKANTKSYSSVSKIKLPWKPFNILKIPQFFENTYVQTKKLTSQQMNDEEGGMEESEKKLWKDHKQILKKHMEKKEQFKRKFRPRTALKERKDIAEQTLGKTGQTYNFFLQKVVEKGGHFSYDRDELKQQVLNKLKNGKSKTATGFKNTHRAKSALQKSSMTHKTQGFTCEDRPSSVRPNLHQQKQNLRKGRRFVDQRQYLSFEKGDEIISKYKENIRQVDCAISDYNIKKTVTLLKNLQNLAHGLK